jgi:putative effector of murein hydrolase
VARYRFAGFLAGLFTALGVMLVVLGCVLAGLLVFMGYRWPTQMPAGNQWLDRAIGPAVVVLAALLLGGPVIVTGQFLRVLLGQRRVLSRIERVMRSDARNPEPQEPPVTGRFGRFPP